MPIKNLNKRLVETLKIKIGGKGAERDGKKGKYRLPVKWDHFKVTGLEKDSKDNFIPDAGIMATLGDKPKALPILLLTDDIDKNFQTAYACYQGSKLYCIGDGELADRRVDAKCTMHVFKKYSEDYPDTPIFENKEVMSGNKAKIECNTETCDIFLSGACKPSGILSCMLPQSEKVGGVAKFRTHSWNSIINITSSLEAIKLITGGVLFGIPLSMELIEKQTEEHGKVKVVNIVYNGGMQKLQLEAGRQKQLRLTGSVSMDNQNDMLDNSGVLVDHDSPIDVQDEFYNQEPEIVEEKSEPKVKGTSAEDLGKKIAGKKVPPKTTEKKEDSELPMF